MEGKTVKQRYVAAWSTVENPPLDKVNPHFKSKYASLAATMEAVRSACKPQGIAYMQKLVKAEGGELELHSFIVTDEGEIAELSVFPVGSSANPQSFGSGLTYAKRQQAQADWGIVGEEDDDGEAAAKTAPKSGAVNARCLGCGTVWAFQSAGQLAGAKCANCGGDSFEAV